MFSYNLLFQQKMRGGLIIITKSGTHAKLGDGWWGRVVEKMGVVSLEWWGTIDSKWGP